MKIVGDSEARNLKRFPQKWSAGKETIRREQTLSPSLLKNRTMKLICQSSSTRKMMQSSYKGGGEQYWFCCNTEMWHKAKGRIEESWSSVCLILNLVSHHYWSKHATVFLTPNLFLLTVFTTVMKSYDKVEAVFRVTNIVICDFVVLKWCLCALVREVAL